MQPRLSAPLAYFITFHTYGTWLPGDPRGSVDAHHRIAGTPCVGLSEGRKAASARRLAHPPVELCPEERTLVLRTTQEVCRHRGWVLHAANIRVNHVHAVLRAEPSPERVMNDLKAWATRRVIEAGLRPPGDAAVGTSRKHPPPVETGGGPCGVRLCGGTAGWREAVGDWMKIATCGESTC